MSKVNGQSVAAQRRACGRDPPKEKNVPRETWACGLLPVDYTCGLWCVLVGGTHPYFLFLPCSTQGQLYFVIFWDYNINKVYRTTSYPISY